MTNPADETIAALRSGYDELAAIVRDLRPDQLTGPSAAAEWDISQVLSHLGSGAEIGLAALTRSLEGGPKLPDDFYPSVWARWDAMSPQERAATFPVTNEALVSRYEALDAETRANHRIDLGFIPVPVDVATSAGLRLSEFALHSWDVRVILDPAATVAPEAVEPLLNVAPLLFGFAAKPAVLGGRPVSLRVELTAPERVEGVILTDTAVLSPTAPADADAVLTIPAEAWLRLVAGRLAPQYTPAGVEVTGTIDLDELRQVFPGY
ncbi:uncharacterized protein (TIGR03083 family) [Allocatelliglobosispora scoriae]|uniref:Uncharacterized protein (TIGR03083 family) n=1 Tax=Allocatelliglobosispora scoriae TaxID=643052 RepID=A0A841C334_9ACTN|nr:maleylpyruvate isomerase family mycothiol-dependent enzyme [Allocatelliglobosispora scoriae]MBB5873251.1 uncharacterized protein (TIGR03083 family) [Allocatelliglobosispora scoriae]